jgi:multicomponent Na+:H+ antiporter subunit B
MLKNYNLLKTIISFLIPYIILYAIYIQLNGEVSPGGGFQAGVIFATGLIAYDLIFSKKALQQYFSIKSLVICANLGVMIYASTGAISLIFNKNFLNYSAIAQNPITGQHIGIFLIEIGVGVTVSSVMILIYSLLRDD